MLGFVLIKYCGQLDEAEAILLQGLEKFPDDVPIGMQYARAADYRRDWSEALRRWDALIVRFPSDPAVIEGRGETLARKQLREIDGVGETPASAWDNKGRGHTERENYKDLLMQFESIGENCEFGLVQRHFGAEPLGLLRWVSLAPEALCLALENEFEGLDDAQDLKVELVGPEYHMLESRYQMRMHTFIVRSEYSGTLEQLHAQLHRRLKYLKNKFLEDLRAGEKTLVWQSGVGSILSDETVLRLYNAVSAYGDSALVVVRRHDRVQFPLLTG